MSRLELKDTVELMCSSDYRDRFVGEYIQTKIRYEKLKAFNTRIEAARRAASSDADRELAEPEHDCPANLLLEQQAAMGEYLHILEVRALIEDIDLADVEMWLNEKKGTSSVGQCPTPSPAGEGLRDEELKLSLEEYEDDWDVVSEAVGRVLEKGLCNDSDEEKLMAAALNVLHKVRKAETPSSVDNKRCRQCVHLPICEYCDRFLNGFMLPTKPNECDMYLRIKEGQNGKANG